MKIKFMLGDYSQDGNGQFDYYIIEINCNNEELEQYYSKSVEKFKIDPREDCFNDYCDNTMSFEIANVFMSAGYNFETDDEDYCHKSEYGYVFSTIAYVHFILWFIMQSNPDLKYNFVDDYIPLFDIGGYGFFGD